MSTQKWNVTFRVYRKKADKAPYFDDFPMEVNPDEYVLDVVERIWAFKDRSLTFAHACHHSTCGACGMRVNGVEKLTCITPVREVTSDGSVVKVEPLRNFPVVSDLSVDMGLLYVNMGKSGHRPVVSLSVEPAQAGIEATKAKADDLLRLSDCIECGMCISACPVATTTVSYLGPAVMAGAQQHGLDGDKELLAFVDCADGVWRCHSAFECTQVCPSNVEPGTKIMQLRRAVIGSRLQAIFGKAK